MKIRVINFQGVSDATITVSGFTLLLGPTHSGKSSFIRAILSSLYLTVPSDYVKFGATRAEVVLDTGDHVWMWGKGCVGSRDGSHQITIDDIIHEKIGRTIPISLLQIIGFAPQQIENSTFFPQFQRQLSSLFALGDDVSSSMLFNLILSFSTYDRLPDMRKEVFTDLKEALSVKQSKEAIFTHISSRWEGISAAGIVYEDSVNLRAKAVSLLDDIETINSYISLSHKIEAKKSAVDGVKDIGDSLCQMVKYMEAARIARDIQTSRRNLDCLSAVRIKPSVYDTVSQVAEEVRTISAVSKLHDELSCKYAEYTRFTSIPSLAEITKTSTILREILNAISIISLSSLIEGRRRRLDATLSTVSGVCFNRVSSEVDLLRSSTSRLWFFIGIIHKMRIAMHALRDLESKESCIAGEISSVTRQLSKYTICPLCGASRGGSMSQAELPTVAEIELLQKSVASLQQQYAVVMERKRHEESVIADLEAQVRKHGFSDNDALKAYVSSMVPKVRQEYDSLVQYVNAATLALNQATSI
jgi:hypothetical protein